MATDFGSLLSLDSLTGEQATRIAVYKMAIRLSSALTEAPLITDVADKIFEFVGGSAWRLEALDIAIQRTGRRSNVENCIKTAQDIADWVQPPVNIPVARAVERPVKKKATARRV